MRVISLVVATGATLVVARGTHSMGDVAGCADSGPELNDYTLIRRTCAPCALSDLGPAAAGPGAANCGDFADPDAGTADCVWRAIDAGRPFVAYGHLHETDSNVSFAFTRDDAGQNRMFWYDDFGENLTCDRRIERTSCTSFAPNAANLVCVGLNSAVSACDERQTLTLTDAGLRPLSELHCEGGRCWIDTSSPETGMHCRYGYVCTDAPYGLSCTNVVYLARDGG